MVEIFADETDDPGSILAIERIVNGCLLEYDPAGIYLVRVRGWFDHKWLGFSGKVGGQLGVWKKTLTLPPFNPNRILSQRFYVYSPEDNDYMRSTGWARLHRYQPSSDNLRRYVGRVGSSVALVWFSSDTLESGRGSLMVYVRTPRKIDGWFLSLERKEDGWRKQTNNISIAVVEDLEDVGRELELHLEAVE
ncbi:hypothetical protein EON83_14630 [bacterium]|nr:MAG: hypothetical protein EON83_14630 [bacterium]